MAFYLSPLVDVNEIDLTTTIPAVSTSIAALVIRKSWKGPELKRQLITTLEELVDQFGRPDNYSYKDMLAAVGYLKYGNKLYCTRAMPSTSTFAGIYGSLGSSASSIASFTAYTTGQAFTLSSFSSDDPDNFHEETFQFSTLPTSGHNISIIASSRGTWGNYTKVAIIDYDTYSLAISASGGTFAQYQSLGGQLNEDVWEDLDSIDYPIESRNEFIVLVKSAKQEDLNKTTIAYHNREVWYVSTNETKIDDEGKNIFAPNIINSNSKYIRIAMDSDTVNNNFYCATVSYVALAGGLDGFTTWDADSSLEDTAAILAYDLYENAEEVDVNILIDADKNLAVKQELVEIAGSRKDCIALLDCRSTDVVNQSGSEVENLRDYRLSVLNENTSYAALYGNWLEVFDTWSSKYRWTPASGHIAGILANTDDVSDPWFAPAGLNRGLLENIRSLAWSPTLGERDILYKNGINPIVTFSGQGKVVWGQKTLLDKNSAFNRINVRRLFMIIEKAIATSAKYFLFEPNDEFTRLSLVNMIDPYLRDVKGRRGVYDFMIVCDERNNTPERIDRQELWLDIYIKPVKAAEFIVLNFIATKTGASFTELVAENTEL
jgi:phage tail sheath protein FI